MSLAGEPLHEDWESEASCLDWPDPNTFFPGQEDWNDLQLAREVCATCPVRAPCLEKGLYERFGIWGGTTEKERKRLRRQRTALRDDVG